MEELRTLYISIFALFILLLLYINIHKQKQKILLQDRLFKIAVILNFCMIIIELLSWIFDKKPGQINLVLNTTFNLLLFVFALTGGIFGYLYANLQIYQDEMRLRKLKNPLIVFFGINMLLSVLSLQTGWFFKVDAANIYHRGAYYWAHVVLIYSIIIYTEFLIIHNRKRIEKKNYLTMLLFPVPPLVGGLMQALQYGLSLSWCGMSLSLLLVYFNMQDEALNTDYLTGAYNRRQLDYYIEQKIRNSNNAKSFSVILIDLDRFKFVNDKYGHAVGDDVLKTTVNLLRKSLGKDDFLARFGGDEFYIILDISDRTLLEKAVKKIKHNINNYNLTGDKPYKIAFSVGYDIYDCSLKQSYNDFLKHIDICMYNDKKTKYIQKLHEHNRTPTI